MTVQNHNQEVANERPAVDVQNPVATGRDRRSLLLQWRSLKQQKPNHVVLLRSGDVYEAFDMDAVIVAEVCDHVLVAELVQGENGKVPNATIEYTSNRDIAELIQAGHKVVTAEEI